MKCYFCDSEEISEEQGPVEKPTSYKCPRCGYICLAEEATWDQDFFNDDDKKIISIYLRNEYERRNRTPFTKRLARGDLMQTVKQYKPLDPLEKIDNALLNLEKASKYVGMKINFNPGNEYPYYHCNNSEELRTILSLLHKDDFIHAPDPYNPHNDSYITTKGYERLRELRRFRKDSRQCFVAMWFAVEMNDVYENAIRSAIEYIEEGEKGPKFEAIRIDNVEHTNDINDEVIAAIRRSRFMVCDLTGYRGGVYFEAGFAYGLGMEVIYTCREDWVKSKKLELYDSNKEKIDMKQEGIHFDIEHRNHIRWSEDNLDEFKEKLTNRIKAVIV